MNDISIVRRSASDEEFIEMRQSVGWGHPEKEVILQGYQSTGCGRVGTGGGMVY